MPIEDVNFAYMKNIIFLQSSAEGGGGRDQVAGARPRVGLEGQQKSPGKAGLNFRELR